MVCAAVVCASGGSDVGSLIGGVGVVGGGLVAATVAVGFVVGDVGSLIGGGFGVVVGGLVAATVVVGFVSVVGSLIGGGVGVVGGGLVTATVAVGFVSVVGGLVCERWLTSK